MGTVNPPPSPVVPGNATELVAADGFNKGTQMQIQPYSKKNGKSKFGAGPWYIGMELEVEAPSYDRLHEGMGFRKSPKSIIAKRDASLGSYGVELVTAPISPELWLDPKCHIIKNGKHTGKFANGQSTNVTGKFFHLLKQLRDIGFNSYESGRCGLHMHVSRTVFIEPTRTHLPRFRELIHGEFFARASQRRGNRMTDSSRDNQLFRYCKRHTGTGMSEYQQQGRYEALNLTEHTAEVRIFRGNIREDRVRAAVELVIAAVEFTRQSADNNTDEAFVAYVKANAITYPFAARRVAEIEMQVTFGSTPTESEAR